jgi:type I restriction enzyme S subunit
MIELNDICELIVDCEHKTAPTEDSGFPSIRTPNIGKGVFILDGVNRVSEETYRQWTRRAVPQAGDLIMAREAPVGNVAMIPVGLVPCLGQRTLLIRPDRSMVEPSYLNYFLNGPYVQSLVQAKTNGATVPHLNMKDVRSLLLPELPPLPIQRRIAGILSAYDDLIENCQRRIKILESMSRAFYREWFVHFRFPGHESVPRAPSPLGEIPQGWEVTTLGDLVGIRKGKNITKDLIRDGSVPVVAGGIAPAYFHDTPNTQSPTITISASGANAGFVRLYHVNVWASDCSFIDLSATPHVLYFYLWLDYRRATVMHLQRGSAQPHVYPKDLAQLEAVRVPKELLDAFTSQIAPIIDQTMRMAAKVETLHRTRDLLLPRLLSGQIDVEASAA